MVTAQHLVAVPRRRTVLLLLLTAPDADFAPLDRQFRAVFESLEIADD